jgi:SUMO ligase MMS21 Smc5/6 complex component
MDRKNLVSTHHFLKNKKYFMLTVEANKSLVDIKQTVANNLAFPLEKEITLKNNGKGAKIVDIKPLN